MSSKRNIESIVQGLYDRPGYRHAVDVTSDEDIGTLRIDLEATIEKLYGIAAVWGRGIRVQVERDDGGTPTRVWVWRALVGGQRTEREGFSGRQRLVRA